MKIRKFLAQRLAPVAIAAIGILQTVPAAAQAVTTQALDRVFSFNANAVLNMAVGNAFRPPDFTNLLVTATNIYTCKLTSVDGLYCLDGPLVRQWPNTLQPGTVSTLFSCADPALGFDNKKGVDPCTSMTVDESGAIWLAAKKHNTHSIIKVVAKGASACLDASWVQLTGGAYCAKELYFGRPPLVDISVVDGDAAKDFRPCPGCAAQGGVLGMEDRKNVTFFPDPQASQPIIVTTNKDLGLGGNEQLQDVALLQLPAGASKSNFVLVTTSNGRIVVKNTGDSSKGYPVYDIVKGRASGSVKCSNATPQYGMRTSSESGIVYVSDSAYCQVIALLPNGPAFANLVHVQQNGHDLVLFTADGPSSTYPVVGLTAAPGIGVDFTNCGVGVECSIVNKQGGDPAAQLSGVQLRGNGKSGATVFQIKGIPDCRYAAQSTFPAVQRAYCVSTPGVIINPDGSAATVNADGTSNSPVPPAGQRLNVTPMLPHEATVGFDNSGIAPKGLPPLLVSPQYRAQQRNNFIFGALFVHPQPGVSFINTFEGDFDIPGLEGLSPGVLSLGCPGDPAHLRTWDIATTVSETYISVGGNYGDMLNNIGCGTVKIGANKLSLLPYDMEVAPDTYGPTITSGTPAPTPGNDAVFGRLMQSLYVDLGNVRSNLACVQVDKLPGDPPLSAGDCSALGALWTTGKAKLDSCIAEAFLPRRIRVFRDHDHDNDDDDYFYQINTRADCPAFRQALVNFQNAVPASTPTQDVANRVGELKVRVNVLLNLYDTRFWPSIPVENGFCRERNASCPSNLL